VVKLKMNLWDRALSYFAPQLAVRNARSREMLSSITEGTRTWEDYHAGSRSRSVSQMHQPRAAAADAGLGGLMLARARSRDAYRNQPLAHGVYRDLRIKAIGAGLKPRSRMRQDLLEGVMTEIEIAKLQVQLEELWEIWANDVRSDSLLKLDHYRMTGLALQSQVTNGDAFLLYSLNKSPGWPFDLSCQLIEADRVCNPDSRMDGDPPPFPWPQEHRVWGGVEKTPRGRAVAYWVSSTYPQGDNYEVPTWTRFVARDRTGQPVMLHLHDPDRVDQSRCWPMLAAAMEKLLVLAGYSDAESQAALMAAQPAGFIESPEPMEDLDPQAPYGDNDEADSGQLVTEPGMMIELTPGCKASFPIPGRPNPQYADFYKAQAREVGVVSGLGLEVMMKAFEASYSASRGAMLEAYSVIEDIRRPTISQQCRPTWRRFVERCAFLRHVKLPSAYWTNDLVREAMLWADWIAPARPQIDEVKAANAMEIRTRLGVSTLSEETAAYDGGDWERKQVQAARERRIAAQRDQVTPAQTDAGQAPAEPEDADPDDEDRVEGDEPEEADQ
jgi:lambda family phage portal protein